MAKAKSEEKTAPNRTRSTKTASPPQSRRDKLASLESARKKEQRTRTVKLLVICLDRKTGKILWQREAPRGQQGRLQNVNGPASPSPVTEDG